MRRLLWQPWSDAEVAHLGRLLAKGYTISAAARRLRRRVGLTYEKAHEHGFAVLAAGRPRRKTSKIEESAVVGG